MTASVTKEFGVRRQAVFRATPLFEAGVGSVSARSAERKRCRDPRTARFLSPHKFRHLPERLLEPPRAPRCPCFS